MTEDKFIKTLKDMHLNVFNKKDDSLELQVRFSIQWLVRVDIEVKIISY